MRWKPTIQFLQLLFLILCAANKFNSQTTTTGGLTGLVTDPSLAVVPGATIEIRNNAKGISQTKTTNSDGAYIFTFVVPGNYTLTVTHPGFRSMSQNLDVSPGVISTLNIRLVIPGTSATVKVMGETPLIHAENGDASSTVSGLQVAEVPNPGNDLTYIAQTAPGAIMNTDGGFGNFSILGMPGTSNTFTLNGMTFTGLGYEVNPNGATGLLLGTNEVQEATIVSNGYSGQFGVLAGAAVSYVTKSGGNDFHGNALYFWNGSVLNANDWLNNATGVPRPFDNANQWAGSIGGPIKKGKLFFFLDTEGLRLLVPLAPQEVVLPSPQFEAATIANIDAKFGPNSASDAFYKQIFALYNGAPGANRALPGGFSSQDPTGCTGFTLPNGLGTTVPCAVHYETTLGRPTYESLVTGRVDWNIQLEDRIFLLLGYDHGHQASYTDPISPLFNVNSNQPFWQGQLVETHAFGPSIVNQFLIAGWGVSEIYELANFSDARAALPTSLNWSSANTFTNLGTNQGSPNGFKFAQYQVSDDIVKTWGNHKLGFGTNLLKDYRTDLPGVDQGTLMPFTLDAFYQGGFEPASPLSNATSLTQTFSSHLSQPLSFYNLGFYAQEEWHARSNLSLTLALRAEHQSNPVCLTRCFARLIGPFESTSHDPDQPYNQAILANLKQAYEATSSLVWAPRFSFAWQPLGVSHNAVLRGGIGIFYNAFPGAAALSMASNPPFFNQFDIQDDNIAPNEATSLFKDAMNSNAEFLSAFAAGESFPEIIAQVNGFSPPALTSADRLLRAPQYQKWSLQVQQAFGAATSVSIGYFGNHGIHEVIQNPSANAFGFGTLPQRECTSPPVPPCADPRFSQVTQLTTAGVSNYNGMVVSYQHRFTGWSQGIIQANYTYGHALDEVTNGGLVPFAFGSSLFPQDPNNIRGSYGSADYDVRHSFNANYVWEVPVKAALRGHGPDDMVKGWQISGTVFARTGFPYTVIDYEESSQLGINNFFGPIYAVPVGPLPPSTPCGEGAAIPLAPHPCLPPQTLVNGTPNPNALFVQTTCETGFNTGELPGPSGPCGGPVVSFAQGRNRFRYPNYFNTDFSIMKNTKIPRWENAVLEIGFQFFNFFNHPNFGVPDNYSSDARFGQIFYMSTPPTGILGSGLGGDASPRNIQLKLQLQF
jgi:Carboxypeptidase regulatory-like domain